MYLIDFLIIDRKESVGETAQRIQKQINRQMPISEYLLRIIQERIELTFNNFAEQLDQNYTPTHKTPNYWRIYK